MAVIFKLMGKSNYQFELTLTNLTVNDVAFIKLSLSYAERVTPFKAINV